MALVSESPIISSLSDDPDLRDLVEEFVDTLQERVRSLEAAYRDGSIQDLTRIAHQLKGASGGYGFDTIAETAAGLEQSAKTANSVSEVTRQLEDLVSMCQRAKATPPIPS